MNDEETQENNTENRQIDPIDGIQRSNSYINFVESDDELNNTTEDVVHRLRRLRGSPTNSDDDEQSHLHAGREPGPSISSNPTTAHIQQSSLANRVRQTQPVTQTGPPPTIAPTQNPRTSTPVRDIINMAQHNDTLDDLANQLQNVDIHGRRPMPENQSPEYLPPNEQIKKIHKIELLESQQEAHHSAQLSRLLNSIVNDTSSPNLKALKAEVDQELEQAKQAVKNKTEKLAAAQKIVEYYKSSIQKPIIRNPPPDYKKTFHRTSPKEITSLTGLFDPKNPNTDFSHVWSKLIGYGQSNYFEEREYFDALRYILQGDAYDTFLSFEQSNESLSNIIDYFGKVYTPKRSLNAHRQEVDHFVRRKDESLEIAMLRCLVAIDRLKILYLPTAWPEARINLRRNILTQIITEDTRRYIRLEEDDILEKHGLPIDLDALITMAHKYEVQYNKAPKTEVTTLFQVASGGLSEDPQKLKSELKHLKRETFQEKQQQNMEYNAAPIMAKRFSAEKERESRRTNRDDRVHAQRQNRFDSKRDITPETRPPSPSTFPPPQPTRSRSQPMETTPSYLERQLVKYDPRVQSPSSRSESRSRPTTPTFDPRSRDQNQSYRNPPYDGRNSRYSSQDRYRDLRRQDQNRYTPNQIYPTSPHPPPSQNTQYRSYSSDRSRQYQQPPLQYQRYNDPRQQQQRQYQQNRYRDPAKTYYPENAYQQRQRSYSREREQPYYQQGQNRPQYRDRSYSRDRNVPYDRLRSQDRTGRPPMRSITFNPNNIPSPNPNFREPYISQRNPDYNRMSSRSRERDDRTSRDRGRLSLRSPSPYPEQQQQQYRSRSYDRYEPRSTSMTRVEDIPPSAKMLTVNVNGSKFDKPHQKN